MYYILHSNDIRRDAAKQNQRANYLVHRYRELTLPSLDHLVYRMILRGPNCHQRGTRKSTNTKFEVYTTATDRQGLSQS